MIEKMRDTRVYARYQAAVPNIVLFRSERQTSRSGIAGFDLYAEIKARNLRVLSEEEGRLLIKLGIPEAYTVFGISHIVLWGTQKRRGGKTCVACLRRHFFKKKRWKVSHLPLYRAFFACHPAAVKKI